MMIVVLCSVMSYHVLMLIIRKWWIKTIGHKINIKYFMNPEFWKVFILTSLQGILVLIKYLYFKKENSHI